MTHSSSTSIPLDWLSSSLQNKASSNLYYINYFPILVFNINFVDPTQVHIQVTASRYSYIDYYFHKFIGSALVRFERSTLPEHKGTRTVVLRFLKIIAPLKCVIPLYDGFIGCPKEGDFYCRAHKLWSRNIDNSYSSRGFQLLWDI